ncbi:unnamed protein product, partial [Musa acuminata var. zebrina]
MLPRPSASQCRLHQRVRADGTNNSRQIGWMDHSNIHQYEQGRKIRGKIITKTIV